MASNQQSSSSISPPLLIWFQLVEYDSGEPLEGTTTDKVAVSSSADVADFRDAVKKKDKDDGDAAVLTPFKSSQLQVYKNKAAFDSQKGKWVGQPLKSSAPMDGLGNDEDHALIMVVPRSNKNAPSESPLTDIVTSATDSKRRRISPPSLPWSENPEIAVKTPELISQWISSNFGVPTRDFVHILSSGELKTPLCGREETIKDVAACFDSMYENRALTSRKKRLIPVCSGPPGLGKTRLLEEFNLIFDKCIKVPQDNQRYAVLLTYGNGSSPFDFEKDLVYAEAMLSWRILHKMTEVNEKGKCIDWSDFLSHLPGNCHELTLKTTFKVLELLLLPPPSTSENYGISLFLGFDEYQRLGSDTVDFLLDKLIGQTYRPVVPSRFIVFPLLAGTDISVTRAPRSSQDVTKRISIRPLTVEESCKAVDTLLKELGKDWLLSSGEFAKHAFLLGGSPQLMIRFVESLAKISNEQIVQNYNEILENKRIEISPVALDHGTLVRICAAGIIGKELEDDSEIVGNDLNWRKVSSFGFCNVNERNCITVPYTLFVRLSRILLTETLSLAEQCFIEAVKLLVHLESTFEHEELWLIWEKFGALFYTLKINALLIWGIKEIKLHEFLRGAKFNNYAFGTNLRLKPVRLIYSGEAISKETKETILVGRTSVSLNWVNDNNADTGYVFLNAPNGKAVDIFFCLPGLREGECGAWQNILILDQRKRLSSDISKNMLHSLYQQQESVIPSCFDTENVYMGVFSGYSKVDVSELPKRGFVVTSYLHETFFTALSDHPILSRKINVNVSAQTAIAMLFTTKSRTIPQKVIKRREKCRFVSVEDFVEFVKSCGGTFVVGAIERICV